MTAAIKNALVLGLGVSGCGATRCLLSEGIAVTGVDAADNAGLQEKTEELKAAGADIHLGCMKLPDERYDLAVVSPGISWNSEWCTKLRAGGIPVLSELELGATMCRCPLIAITGTNGKSTAVKLFGNSLILAGKKAMLGGNYGVSLCDVSAQSEKLDWIVVEVSSFQLETVKDFKPNVAVLLNIQPDHLTRHGSMSNYTRAKIGLFENMSKNDGDSAVVPEELIDKIRSGSPVEPEWITFGAGKGACFAYSEGRIVETDYSGSSLKTGVFDISGTLFDNEIMGLTAAAVMAGVRACGMDPSVVQKAVRGFHPLHHRMQPSGDIRGVRYVNDSKATNMAALGAGLSMSRAPVLLIAGGRLKESNLDSVKELLATKVRKVYLIGEASTAMAAAWCDVVNVVSCGELHRAVGMAAEEALDGDTVLFSPGCASFDQFVNYEDRGDTFMSLVSSLQTGDGAE